MGPSTARNKAEGLAVSEPHLDRIAGVESLHSSVLELGRGSTSTVIAGRYKREAREEGAEGEQLENWRSERELREGGLR